MRIYAQKAGASEVLFKNAGSATGEIALYLRIQQIATGCVIAAVLPARSERRGEAT